MSHPPQYEFESLSRFLQQSMHSFVFLLERHPAYLLVELIKVYLYLLIIVGIMFVVAFVEHTPLLPVINLGGILARSLADVPPGRVYHERSLQPQLRIE